jgi:hypothetical protein
MNDNVFVNCPFDDDYKPLFEALVFVIMASGYRVRCALEEDASGDIRFEKLCRLIESSDRSVHDLSRTELNPMGLPRLNMPFELGLCMGAIRFGGKRQKVKKLLIVVNKQYLMPAYLSDLAGNDAVPHGGKAEEVIRLVRRHLHEGPEGIQLPGAKAMIDEFHDFKRMLPDLAAALHNSPDEIDPFREYRSYVSLLAEYLSLV